MTAEELINQMIPPLKPSDSGQKAMDWMEKLRISQLPVVDEGKYVGLLSEERIMDTENIDRPVSDFRLEAENIFAYSSSHFYDVIKLATENSLQLVPVVEKDREFLGVISINETASTLAKMFAGQGPGGIIVLSMEDKDYSLTEISRLVESNDAKILSSFFAPDENTHSQQKLTLKLNKSDLTRIIATFERHGYTVVANFQETELLNVDKERLDLLFKYLNI